MEIWHYKSISVHSCKRVSSVLNTIDERLSINSQLSNSSIMHKVFMLSSTLACSKVILYGVEQSIVRKSIFLPMKISLKPFLLSYSHNHALISLFYIEQLMIDIQLSFFHNFWSLIFISKTFTCIHNVSTIKKHHVLTCHQRSVTMKGILSNCQEYCRANTADKTCNKGWGEQVTAATTQED